MITEQRIQTAYEQSGNECGWRFLCSHRSTMQTATVAFIGLNPGGNAPEPERDGFDMSEGTTAYTHESWGGAAPGESKLQKQVIAVFERLGQRPEDVLSGNLIPFRSPEIAALKSPEFSREFGESLWREILAQAPVDTVVTMGADARDAVWRMLGAINVQKVSYQWGKETASKARSQSGHRLIALPHLSRRQIMLTPKRQAALEELFAH